MNDVPSAWKEHYGEEAFQDIRVYVEYGDRTPEEAVVILGLKPIPPPEKTEEPKQEGLKPSEENIEVKTPEISIKENTNKEVKEMTEEKGSNWYPNTDFEGKGKGWFPNTPDLPEQIEIPTESPYKGGIDGVKGGNVTVMKKDEFGRFVSDRLEMAFTTRQNAIGKSLRYYIAVGEGGEILGSKSAAHLKDLAKELDGAEDYEGKKKILEEAIKYLRGLKMKTEGR
jgi:hypothetical protein